MKIKKITNEIESLAPLSIQESYDNSGLIVGDPESDVQKALICFDVTEEVIEEAIQNNCKLVISHHPLIFAGLKKITYKNHTERVLIQAIKNDIAIYAAHTNLDNVEKGVNYQLSNMLGLKNLSVLKPRKGLLRKLVTFCPQKEAEKVRQAMFKAGAGHIGNYDNCSYNVEGFGSFRAGEGSDPYTGEIGKLHYENEVRIETIYPTYKEDEIIQSMKQVHPYEEVAYDIYPLENEFEKAGAGMIGELTEPMDEIDFLKLLKKSLDSGCIKHSKLLNKSVKRIAVCGGSGSFLITDAINAKADVFVTADIKYHDFFNADNKILLVDAGHYETEQFSKELIHYVLKRKFSTFAFLISKVNTNPINYL